VAICGSNGIGKTNLLDAIHYLSFTKSYFNKPDAISSSSMNNGFRISGSFLLNEVSKEVAVVFRENGKKELQVDQSNINKFSEHIGEFPLVFIAPDDTKLLTGGSEERRNYLDTLLSQWDHEYLTHLIRYNKTLLERNKFLKQLQDGQLNTDLLDVYNQQLVLHGTEILNKRLHFTEELYPMILEIFHHLSDKDENPIITYEASTTSTTYLSDIIQSLQKDIVLQRTTIGIHKDDLDIQMDGLPFKQTASQGQKKSMLFACKLAAFKMLEKHKGYEPILLMDDIFEKLDQYRLNRLLEWVCTLHKGQVFMTDTHADRLEKLMKDISLPFQTIHL
jgi:DNA replication and repair protein RecF